MTAEPDPRCEAILGIDTHQDQHTAVVINGLGQVQATLEIPTTAAGYRELLDWARTFGQVQRAGVEGCGAYGAGLARFLINAGVTVIEVDRPNRQRRRRRGKSDPTDAENAARAVLAGDATGTPKDSNGRVEAVRMLQMTRRSAVKAKTQAANQIKDIVLTAPEALRTELRSLTTNQRVRLVVTWPIEPALDPLSAARRCLTELAKRWLDLHRQINGLNRELRHLLDELVPSLLEQPGVGTDVAAKLVLAVGEDPDRLNSPASFAALCGTSPVEWSSGKNSGHHRLNRGGNRQANNALHVVMLHRWRTDDETKAFIARQRERGKTNRHIQRCLKRALARRLHHDLNTDLRNLLT